MFNKWRVNAHHKKQLRELRTLERLQMMGQPDIIIEKFPGYADTLVNAYAIYKAMYAFSAYAKLGDIDNATRLLELLISKNKIRVLNAEDRAYLEVYLMIFSKRYFESRLDRFFTIEEEKIDEIVYDENVSEYVKFTFPISVG